jgi:hypothetical protein
MPLAAELTPLERDGLMPETEQTQLESELAPPATAGMPPPLDLTPAAADLPLGLADAQPEAGGLTVEPRQCTLAALDLTPAFPDLELVSIDADPRPCSRVDNRGFPTPAKARSIEAAIRQTLFEGPEMVQTGHDLPPFLDTCLDGSARKRSQTVASD